MVPLGYMSERVSQIVALRYIRAHSSALTADVLARQIEAQLAGLFSGWIFGAYNHNILGEDSVSVEFFQAPKGSSQVDTWNAPKYVKVWIHGSKWEKGASSPDKVVADVSRSKGIKPPRKTSGPPEKVVASVIKWFKQNHDILVGKD